jgi:homoserine dehydrogenase
MKQISLALVGFGNVGRSLARLLLRKHDRFVHERDLEIIVTGITTARHGTAIDPHGIDLEKALALVESHQLLDGLSKVTKPGSVMEFIQATPADALMENTPVNHHDGQPAIDYLRAGLLRGMHAITANKGPVVHAYKELTELASKQGRRFLFESAVMDGTPIFSMFRSCLPAADLIGFKGILNATTNLILKQMEAGLTFDQAIEVARAIGIVEADPSEDVDGWDAAIKISALVTVLMDIPLKPQEVDREGIRAITPQMVQEAKMAGERWKLVCTARREGNKVLATVKPQRVKPDSPFYHVFGSSSFVQFETDVLPGLGILEGETGTEATAYGLLADLLNAI